MSEFFAILKYKLFGKKIQIKTIEVADRLIGEVLTVIFQDFMEEVDDIALKTEINLTEEDKDTIRGAVLQIVFWICIHALEYDDPNFIEALHSAFFNKMEKMNIPPETLKTSLQSHFIKYNKAWKDWEDNPESGISFGYSILCGVFNSGLPDKRFLDPLLSAQITSFISATILAITEYKEKINKMYELY